MNSSIEAVTGFLISRPGAVLTGHFRDRAIGGDLAVGAEVRVGLSGRYHLKATIGSVDGRLIGSAQGAHQLESGKHWIDLTFYGLMFNDHASAGPYRIAAITLTDATGMPNALSDVIRDVHTTRAYPLSRFTRESYGNPALLELARRLEAEAAHSRGDG